MAIQNVESRVEGNKLIIEVDLTKNFGLSKSEKTNIVGGSGGFVPIPGKEGMSFGINVISKVAKK